MYVNKGILGASMRKYSVFYLLIKGLRILYNEGNSRRFFQRDCSYTTGTSEVKSLEICHGFAIKEHYIVLSGTSRFVLLEVVYRTQCLNLDVMCGWFSLTFSSIFAECFSVGERAIES